MHWFNYVWMLPIGIALLIWAYFSIRDIIKTVRDYIKEPEDDVLTYMDCWLEDYTKGFISTTLVLLTLASFISFVWDCIPAE